MIQIGNLDEVIKAIRNDAVIECAMLIYGLEAETPLMVTNSDLVSSTFTLDRYCQSADSLEIGSACAAELSFSLLNYNGKFTGFKFEGAKIIPRLRIKDITSWITIGEFVIDEKPKQLNTIHIVALDRMVVMDKVIDWTTFAWSSNSKALVTQICDDCDIVLASDALDRLVSVNIFTNCPTTEMTYRQLLQQIMQFSCCNAFINEDGKLDFAWYKSTKAGTSFTLTTADRFTGSVEETSLQPNSYIFKTVNSNGDEEESIAYTNSSGGDFDFVFESNELANLNNFNSTTQLAIAKKNSSLGTVRAFTATTLPFFFLQPMDEIIFVTADGEEISTTVTHFTFKLNAGAKIECKLPTMSNSGYASLGALTAKEKQLINSIRLKEKQLSVDKTALDTLTAREEALLSYNKAVNNGVFLNKTEYNGQVYYHNGDTLEESTYIMVQNSEGTYWTNQGGWDSTNDPPVTYEYAIAADGTSVLSDIFAYRINADLIQVDDLFALSAKIGGWNISETAFYADKGNYRAYIQAPINSDSWIFSTQVKATEDSGLEELDAYYSTFLVKMNGELNARTIITNHSYGNRFAGLTHYRTHTFDGTNQTTWSAGFGIGVVEQQPTLALELKNSSNVIKARLDILESTSSDCLIDLVGIWGNSTTSTKISKRLSLGADALRWDGTGYFSNVRSKRVYVDDDYGIYTNNGYSILMCSTSSNIYIGYGWGPEITLNGPTIVNSNLTVKGNLTVNRVDFNQGLYFNNLKGITASGTTGSGVQYAWLAVNVSTGELIAIP